MLMFVSTQYMNRYNVRVGVKFLSSILRTFLSCDTVANKSLREFCSVMVFSDLGERTSPGDTTGA